jgi:ATP-binding protein involved in chromosome partitioning
MYEKVNVPVLGLIENMSYYNNPDGTKEYIFGQGGGTRLAKEMGINFLGEIAINTSIRKGGDEGKPIVLGNPEALESVQFTTIARNLAEQVKEKAKNNMKLPVIEI